MRRYHPYYIVCFVIAFIAMCLGCSDFIDPQQQAHDLFEQSKQYKKEKGQSYKPTGFKTFYKKLCELSGNNPQVAMSIIEQSMQNNYAGIFPLRNNNNNNYGRETITDKIRRTVEEANMKDGKVDIDSLEAIAFDPYTHGYYKVGGRVGEAFKDGAKLK